jgi:hypothetical protein
VKHTVIALFDQAEDARKAGRALEARGFDASAVHLTQGGESLEDEVISPAIEIESGPLTGLLHRLSVLFSVKEPHLAHYHEAVRRGGTVVQVDAYDEAQAAAARDALLAAGAVTIDDRVEEWQRSGWSSPDVGGEAAASARGIESPGGIVHKQEASIGGVRVYGHVVVVPFDDLADDFRADYEAHYAVQGASFDDFDPAYRYGHALASDTRYDGRSWDEIEPEARVEWERRHPRSAWERFKSAVRHAWQRSMGQ